MRATRSVLRPDAPNCFYVIAGAEDLTDKDRERLAVRDGNEHVESQVPYDMLMEKAGFVDVDLTDVTAQYAETLMGWKREWEADADAFIDLVGKKEFIRRTRNRDLDIAAVSDGLLRRYRVYGVKPRRRNWAIPSSG
ncbi:MAG: hypothetical protein ACC658_06545 [Acidimicrobiia bacterium]